MCVTSLMVVHGPIYGCFIGLTLYREETVYINLGLSCEVTLLLDHV